MDPRLHQHERVNEAWMATAHALPGGSSAPDAVAGESELFEAVGVLEVREKLLGLLAAEEAKIGDDLQLRTNSLVERERLP